MFDKVNKGDHMKSRSIGIVSGKGGVGKTTTVSNLGVVLSYYLGRKTIVADANLLTANLGIHLNLLYPPVTLADCLKGEIPINKIIYPHPSGLNIIPSSIVMNEILDDTILRKVMDSIKGQFDFVIFDSSPGLGKETSSVVKAADELIVITTPDLPSVSDTAKAVKIAEDMDVPVLGIIINRVRGYKYELTQHEIEKICKCTTIATIPEDKKVPESIAFKNPVVLYSPNSPAARAFKTLASELSGRKLGRGLGNLRSLPRIAPPKVGIIRRLWNFLFRKY